MSQLRSGQKARRSVRWKYLAASFFSVAGGISFVVFAYPFLALNEPVAADAMVVEGWVPHSVWVLAAQEFKERHYSHIFVSGFYYEKGDPDFEKGSNAAWAARHLALLGVSPSQIEIFPTDHTVFNRTSHMARAVRDGIRRSGFTPHGVNVVTLGSHGRQSLIAYRRMLGSSTPVGVITFPSELYNRHRWWASLIGIRKTTGDFFAWIKEIAVGLRS